MDKYGFLKVAAAVPCVKVADPMQNVTVMEPLLRQAISAGVEIVVFPELGLTGYTCGDLFFKPALVQTAQTALKILLNRFEKTNLVFVVGLPIRVGNVLLNAAAVCCRGKILGIVPKTYLSLSGACCETRYFTSALDWSSDTLSLCGQQVPVGTDLIFEVNGAKIGVEIGDDLLAAVPPSSLACLQGADVIVNLSATAALVGKYPYMRTLVQQQSARGLCGYVYASCGFGESTTDWAFGADAFIYENGQLLASTERFSTKSQLICTEIDVERLRNRRYIHGSFRADCLCETTGPYLVVESGLLPVKKSFALTRPIDPLPFVPQGEQLAQNCREVFNIQTNGLATRLLAAHTQIVVVGISGGLDSTLALLVCARVFDKLGWPRKNIIGVTMPGFGTTDRTYRNALAFMKKLGVTLREISIKQACLQHFKDIGHSVHLKDVTYENTQARERTQILMDIANQKGGLVVGTGDLSESALGWATYNGDHMSMYNVNAGVPKTLVRSLVKFISEQGDNVSVRPVLQDVLNTPISPELLPADKNGKIAQKTENLVGPYELHDFFLYYFLRCGFGPAKIYRLATLAFKKEFSPAMIKKWLKVFFSRFFSQQFKRSCSPDGPKVGTVGLSPRGDWYMPSDASVAIWKEEIESL